MGEDQGEEAHFGYKNHVKVDEKSKLIEKYEVTDASVHDSQKIEDLVEKGDGSTVSSPSNGLPQRPFRIEAPRGRLFRATSVPSPKFADQIWRWFSR